MCICPEYEHAFISTYIATCRYCQCTVHADNILWQGVCKFSRTL